MQLAFFSLQPSGILIYWALTIFPSPNSSHFKSLEISLCHWCFTNPKERHTIADEGKRHPESQPRDVHRGWEGWSTWAVPGSWSETMSWPPRPCFLSLARMHLLSHLPTSIKCFQRQLNGFQPKATLSSKIPDLTLYNLHPDVKHRFVLINRSLTFQTG